MCVTGWIGIAYSLRTQVIIIRDREYNLASRCLGSSTVRIAVKNILPFMISFIVTIMAQQIPAYIASEAFLSYIGLGISDTTLGKILYQLPERHGHARLGLGVLVPGHAQRVHLRRALPHRPEPRRRRRPEDAYVTGGTMEDKNVLLSIKDLWVKFRVRGRVLTAIRDVRLDIYENESIAIVGESGCGKSVLTKTFAGMLDNNGFIDKRRHLLQRPRPHRHRRRRELVYEAAHRQRYEAKLNEMSRARARRRRPGGRSAPSRRTRRSA